MLFEYKRGKKNKAPYSQVGHPQTKEMGAAGRTKAKLIGTSHLHVREVEDYGREAIRARLAAVVVMPSTDGNVCGGSES